MKKYISYILILVTLIGTLVPVAFLQAQEESGYCFNSSGNLLIGERTTLERCQNIEGGILVTARPLCEENSAGRLSPLWLTEDICQNVISTLDTLSAEAELFNQRPYELLTPLPSFQTFDPTDENALGSYLNTMIRIFIGICAVLAMMMIILGGLEYMTSELISSKDAGKKKITGALLGLVLALGSYALLNTINKDLLDTRVQIKDVLITLDEQLFALTETTMTASATFLTNEINPEITDFIENYLDEVGPLRAVIVNTTSRQASFCTTVDGTGHCVFVPVGLGINGTSEEGGAVEGDGKTPKGRTAITHDRRIAVGNTAIPDRSGQYNMGPAFINIGVVTEDGKNRGIGFHGSFGNTLIDTNGCIRMYNQDLAALAPFMTTGLEVIIK